MCVGMRKERRLRRQATRRNRKAHLLQERGVEQLDAGRGALQVDEDLVHVALDDRHGGRPEVAGD